MEETGLVKKKGFVGTAFPSSELICTENNQNHSLDMEKSKARRIRRATAPNLVAGEKQKEGVLLSRLYHRLRTLSVVGIVAANRNNLASGLPVGGRGEGSGHFVRSKGNELFPKR